MIQSIFLILVHSIFKFLITRKTSIYADMNNRAQTFLEKNEKKTQKLEQTHDNLYGYTFMPSMMPKKEFNMIHYFFSTMLHFIFNSFFLFTRKFQTSVKLKPFQKSKKYFHLLQRHRSKRISHARTLDRHHLIQAHGECPHFTSPGWRYIFNLHFLMHHRIIFDGNFKLKPPLVIQRPRKFFKSPLLKRS